MAAITPHSRLIGRPVRLFAIMIGGCLVAPLAGTGPLSAQTVGTARWCVDMGDLGNGYLECQYHTYAQCAARASGLTNICQQNPWYVPRRQASPRPRRKPRR